MTENNKDNNKNIFVQFFEWCKRFFLHPTTENIKEHNIILDACKFPFNKENLVETLIVFIASLIFSFMHLIGNMISFAIRISYAVKLYRIKTNLIKEEDESSFESVLDLIKFQLWFFVPILIISIICVIIFKLYPANLIILLLALPIILKISFLSSILLDIMFVFLGFGLFINFAINRKANLKIAFNILKKNAITIFLCFLPFLLYSIVIFIFIYKSDILELIGKIYNYFPIIILLNWFKYYLFLIGIILFANITPIKEQDLEKYKFPIFAKKSILIFGAFITLIILFYYNKNNIDNFLNNDLLGKGTWSYTAPLNHPRNYPQLTLLKDGNVLVTGGYNSKGEVLNSAEIYDVKNNKFIEISSMNNRRFGHSATLLKDGSVLIVGGSSCFSNNKINLSLLKTAELYDSKTQKFIKINDLQFHIFHHFSILLNDGKVLIIPNPDYFSTENTLLAKKQNIKGIIYNPKSKDFSYSNDLYYSKGHFYEPIKNKDNNILLIINPKNMTQSIECKSNRDLIGCNDNSVIFDVQKEKFFKNKSKIQILEDILIPISSNEIFLLNNFTGNARILNIDNFEEKTSKNKIKIIKTFPNQINYIKNNIFIQTIDKNNKYKTYLFDIKNMKFRKAKNPHYKQIDGSSIKLPNGNILIIGETTKYNKEFSKALIYKY